MNKHSPILLLGTEVKHYDWGHPTVIYDIIGTPPLDAPGAELWMGAHPSGSSVILETGKRLIDAIADDKMGFLGEVLAQKGMETLPFLLKLLAVQKPLSIQCHPSLYKARAGFSAENNAGVPLDAPNRNYKDPNHKPELIVAVSQFKALCGFMPWEKIKELFADVSMGVLCGLLTPDMKQLTENILHLQQRDDFQHIMEEFTERCKQLPRSPFTEAVTASEHYHNDVGLLFFLVLDLIDLNHGDSIYIPAGVLHAYVSGTGVEIMANSDNVLRCGLTKKHIDVTQLLDVVDSQQQVRIMRHNDDVTEYSCPTGEFKLIRYIHNDFNKTYVHKNVYPGVIFTLRGKCQVVYDGQKVMLNHGQSCYIRPAGGQIELHVDGETYLATVGGT